jgi:hypothetical protein
MFKTGTTDCCPRRLGGEISNYSGFIPPPPILPSPFPLLTPFLAAYSLWMQSFVTRGAIGSGISSMVKHRSYVYSKEDMLSHVIKPPCHRLFTCTNEAWSSNFHLMVLQIRDVYFYSSKIQYPGSYRISLYHRISILRVVDEFSYREIILGNYKTLLGNFTEFHDIL